ncbi:hypothetical protein B0H16DRAFT_1479124 [Mycena metata]|uniref:Uncharacterized protein n=1 Tax=Mycena metata TaxID=1033252 RepID=A0AAD7H5E7_9AGAR|nr:hypothetical protein B0H16DRAFT_1479124 [Mycena metata]
MEGKQKGVHQKKAGKIPEANCNEPEGVKIRSDNRKVKSKLDDVEVETECGGELKEDYRWKGWGWNFKKGSPNEPGEVPKGLRKPGECAGETGQSPGIDRQDLKRPEFRSDRMKPEETATHFRDHSAFNKEGLEP